jgi:hypothetical protein
MAMSRKAWMTGFLFSAWIDHLIQSLQCSGESPPTDFGPTQLTRHH